MLRRLVNLPHLLALEVSSLDPADNLNTDTKITPAVHTQQITNYIDRIQIHRKLFDNKDLRVSGNLNLCIKEAAQSQDDKSEHQAGKIII